MYNFSIDEQAAQFILQHLGKLPTQSGAYPIFIDLAAQYQKQQAETTTNLKAIQPIENGDTEQ